MRSVRASARRGRADPAGHHRPRAGGGRRRSALGPAAHQAGVGDLVLGIGGGAGMDLAKAVAAMATNDESPTVRDYLERGPRPEDRPAAAAGPGHADHGRTGAQATRNAVISSYDPPFKKSLRDLRILPQIGAVVDPELTIGFRRPSRPPAAWTRSRNCWKVYISRKAQPIPQALAVQGLRLALPAMSRPSTTALRRPARENMAHAALLSGLCLANSGLGMAHGVAAALGVLCRTPHGLASR